MAFGALEQIQQSHGPGSYVRDKTWSMVASRERGLAVLVVERNSHNRGESGGRATRAGVRDVSFSGILRDI